MVSNLGFVFVTSQVTEPVLLKEKYADLLGSSSFPL